MSYKQSYTPEEQRRLWTHVYRSLELPVELRRPHTGRSSVTIETISSGNSKFSNHPAWDLTVSTLEPHHTVRIDYPALEILEDPSERGVLHKPFNVAQRHQPLPLIADNSIFLNAGRDKVGAVTFYSLYRAASNPPWPRTVSGLLQPDVREATKYHGKTRLRVVIYQTPQEYGLRVRVRRSTTYLLMDGARDEGVFDYDFSYDEFFSIKNQARWFQDILHLVSMRDDRSARYVQFKLWLLASRQPEPFPGSKELFDSFCDSWRKRRAPDYELYLNGLVTDVPRPSSLLRTKPCKICRKPFDHLDHTCVSLPCCSKLVSKHCLVEWCEATNAQTLIPNFQVPSCPVCKTELFQDIRTMDHLKFGILADTYWKDDRLTGWENFEKSCADLDLQNAGSNTTLIKVNPTLLWFAFRSHAKSSQRRDDPVHLNPMATPEYNLFESEFTDLIKHLDGVESSIGNLYNHLTHEILRTFKRRFRAAGLDLFLRPDQRAYIDSAVEKEFFFRDGFLEFVLRALNRACQFLDKRACPCTPGEESHQHDDDGRDMFDPKYWSGIIPAYLGEIRAWQRSAAGREYIARFKEGEGKVNAGRQ